MGRGDLNLDFCSHVLCDEVKVSANENRQRGRDRDRGRDSEEETERQNLKTSESGWPQENWGFVSD